MNTNTSSLILEELVSVGNLTKGLIFLEKQKQKKKRTLSCVYIDSNEQDLTESYRRIILCDDGFNC